MSHRIRHWYQVGFRTSADFVSDLAPIARRVLTQGRPCASHWRDALWYGRWGAILSRRLRSGPLDSGLGSYAFQQSEVFPKGKHDDINDSSRRRISERLFDPE
jgi:hypothetical protein